MYGFDSIILYYSQHTENDSNLAPETQKITTSAEFHNITNKIAVDYFSSHTSGGYIKSQVGLLGPERPCMMARIAGRLLGSGTIHRGRLAFWTPSLPLSAFGADL